MYFLTFINLFGGVGIWGHLDKDIVSKLKKDGKFMELIIDLKNKNGCDFNYRCSTQDIFNICPVKDISLDDFIQLINYPVSCLHSISFGYRYYCNCPVRIYIAKNYEQ